MVDVRVELIDGSYHDVDSSEMAFKIAGSMAVQEAARRAKPVLLEPVMAVEVVTPEEFLGDVIGDLSRRRGKVQGQEPRGNALAVQAFVPLGEMFGYATDLRSSTQGRATYTMQFERYEEVPANIAEQIVEHLRRARSGGSVSRRTRRTMVCNSSGVAPERRQADARHQGAPKDLDNLDRQRDGKRRSKGTRWRRSSIAISRTSTSARSVTSTTARRR